MKIDEPDTPWASPPKELFEDPVEAEADVAMDDVAERLRGIEGGPEGGPEVGPVEGLEAVVLEGSRAGGGLRARGPAADPRVGFEVDLRAVGMVAQRGRHEGSRVRGGKGPTAWSEVGPDQDQGREVRSLAVRGMSVGVRAALRSSRNHSRGRSRSRLGRGSRSLRNRRGRAVRPTGKCSARSRPSSGPSNGAVGVIARTISRHCA